MIPEQRRLQLIEILIESNRSVESIVLRVLENVVGVRCLGSFDYEYNVTDQLIGQKAQFHSGRFAGALSFTSLAGSLRTSLGALSLYKSEGGA